MQLPQVSTGVNGESLLATIEVVFPTTEYIPGKQVLGLSKAYSTTDVAFATAPGGWDSGWHPTPRRQLVTVLSGTLEIRTGDGHLQQFSAGGSFLLDDTTGKGHSTVNPNASDAVVLLAWLDPQR